MSHPASLVGPARDQASRGELAIHDHVCGIYDTSEGEYEPACRFLKVGLSRNEQCLYIAEATTPAEFLALLESHGVDVKAAERNRSLQVLNGEEVRRRIGGFTPDAMFSYLDDAEKNALLGGFAAFRRAADMTWLGGDDVQPGDMFVYESKLTRFLLEHEAVGLCQYAMSDFRPESLIAAVETHPLLAYNDTVCDNFYFIPPEEYLSPRYSDVKLRRILYNIISRERMMSTVLSQ